jgi:hypothetical protein
MKMGNFICKGVPKSEIENTQTIKNTKINKTIGELY